MNKPIARLKLAKAKMYVGVFKYLIAYDYSAGLPERYTVLILNADDPVTVGRELDLTTVRSLIADYEQMGKKLPCYTGGRSDVLLCLKQVSELRRKRYESRTRV